MEYKLISAPDIHARFTVYKTFSSPIDVLSFLVSMSGLDVFFILTRSRGSDVDCWIVDNVVIDALVNRGVLILKGFLK